MTALPDETVESLADALYAAFTTARPIDPPTAAHPNLHIEDAYRIQNALVARHEADGRHVTGRKIGLTSLAMQQQLGVDSPDFGVVFDTHTFSDGTSVSRSASNMILPKVEPELAVVLDRELAGPGVTVDDVAGALRSVVPIIEIIDSRVRDWKISLVDTVADNASGHGLVLGEPVQASQAGPPAAASTTMSRGDEVLQQGEATAVMGDPLAAVAWVANELGRLGDHVPPGMPVLCGSFTAAVDATPGAYTADFGPLGSVSVEITE